VTGGVLQFQVTPLHWASRAGQTAAVQLLLDHGASVHAEAEKVGVVLYYFMPRAPYSILEQPSMLCWLWIDLEMMDWCTENLWSEERREEERVRASRNETEEV